MQEGSGAIGQSETTILLPNFQYTQFRLRYYHRMYNGTTVYINHPSESDLGVSSTYGNYGQNGSDPSGINPTQWARNRLLIEEIAR